MQIKLHNIICTSSKADGRTSLEELAKTTGYTSMGTKKRLQKLLKKGTIKVSALINPAQLKLLPAIVMLEMESAEAMQELILIDLKIALEWFISSKR